jgi:hypothetical protein
MRKIALLFRALGTGFSQPYLKSIKRPEGNKAFLLIHPRTQKILLLFPAHFHTRLILSKKCALILHTIYSNNVPDLNFIAS